MEDIDFKLQVVQDLGVIKTKVENLEKNYVPCEKKSHQRSINTNRKMIFSLYSIIGIIFAGLIIGALTA